MADGHYRRRDSPRRDRFHKSDKYLGGYDGEFHVQPFYDNNGYEVHNPKIQAGYRKYPKPGSQQYPKKYRDEYNVDPTSSSTYDSSLTSDKSNCHRYLSVKCIILLIILFLVIGGLIAVAVYFGVTSQYDYGAEFPTKPVEVSASMTIENWLFTDSLKDPSSDDYKTKASEFCGEVEKVYKYSDLVSAYETCVVMGFSSGSVVVSFVLKFKTPEEKEALEVKQRTVTILSQAVVDKRSGGVDVFVGIKIDIEKLHFEGITKPTTTVNVTTTSEVPTTNPPEFATTETILTVAPTTGLAKLTTTESLATGTTESTTPEAPATEPSTTSTTKSTTTETHTTSTTQSTTTEVPTTEPPTTSTTKSTTMEIPSTSTTKSTTTEVPTTETPTTSTTKVSTTESPTTSTTKSTTETPSVSTTKSTTTEIPRTETSTTSTAKSTTTEVPTAETPTTSTTKPTSTEFPPTESPTTSTTKSTTTKVPTTRPQTISTTTTTITDTTGYSTTMTPTAVYSEAPSVSTTSSPTTVSPEVETAVVFNGSMDVTGYEYKSEFNDTDSEEFKNMSSAFCSDIEKTFRSNADLNDTYESCNVTGIEKVPSAGGARRRRASNGSGIKIMYIIIFIIIEDTEDLSPKPTDSIPNVTNPVTNMTTVLPNPTPKPKKNMLDKVWNFLITTIIEQKNNTDMEPQIKLTMIITAEPASIQMEEVDKCASYDCGNGTCKQMLRLGEAEPTCMCLQGYRGSHCEEEIDECSSNPCQHGGTCTDLIDEFRCSCHREYTGKFCEITMPTTVQTTMEIATAATTETSPLGCVENLVGYFGAFQSPGNPNNYPKNLNCSWTITVPHNWIIKLHFMSFNTEMDHDYVEVYDGMEGSSQHLISRFSGIKAPFVVRSKKNTMLVIMISNGNISRSGFQAWFAAENIVVPTSPLITTASPVTTEGTTSPTSPPAGCGGSLGGNSGYFYSPGYPYNYPNSVHCSWIITVDVGYIVQLQFRYFNTESGYDYVNIYDGRVASFLHRLGRFTGPSLPPVIQSSNNSMLVVMTSDGSVTRGGFRAYYTASVAPIPMQFRLVNGTRDSEGRLEVLYNGVWGSVCDDGFSVDDARTVCQILGYSSVTHFPLIYDSAYFGKSDGPIWIDNLNCSSEVRCRNSQQTLWGVHNCSHSEDVGLKCVPYNDIEVRLVDGKTDREGRVEINLGGEWGTICDDQWSSTTSSLICQMLGFSGFPLIGNPDGPKPGTGRIWLDYFWCYSSYGNFTQCIKQSWRNLGRHNCGHREDVWLQCKVPDIGIRLSEGTKPKSGLVEVFYNNSWWRVCADYSDSFDDSAKVVCHMLGYR